MWSRWRAGGGRRFGHARVRVGDGRRIARVGAGLSPTATNTRTPADDREHGKREPDWIDRACAPRRSHSSRVAQFDADAWRRPRRTRAYLRSAREEDRLAIHEVERRVDSEVRFDRVTLRVE